MYTSIEALLRGCLLYGEVNVIIYSQTVPSVGVEPTLGGFERGLLLLIARRTLRVCSSHLFGEFSLDAGDGGFLG